MLIQTLILYCDGKVRGEPCKNRLLISDTLQPLIEAINKGWKMINPTVARAGKAGETKHYCSMCAATKSH